MSYETKTTLDKLLKDVYANVVREQVNTFSGLQQIFEKVEDAEFDGRKVIEGTTMSFNEGVGAVGEDANLPTAGQLIPEQFNIAMKYVYGSFQMTKQMMESAKTSKGAFKNATRYSFETLIRNLKRERARMLWGNGTGALARVNDATPDGAAAIGIDDPGGVTGTFGGTRYLRKGMIVCFGATPGSGLNRTISSVDSGTQITLDSATSGNADNNLIYRVSTTASTTAGDLSKDNEPVGLLGLVDDGTYLATISGLSRSTYPQLNSYCSSSVGALSLDLIQQHFDIADQRGDGAIDYMACHHAVRRAYLTLLEADRRYTGADLNAPDGGTKAAKRGQYVTFSGVPMIEDKYAPYDMLFGVSKADMKRYVQIDGEWAEESGAILRQVTGKDTWTAFYRLWENYHCSRPNANFRMAGISTSKVFIQDY